MWGKLEKVWWKSLLKKIKHIVLTLMAFILVSGPLAPSVFAEEADIQKLEAQLTSELQKVNTKYQEIESLNQQIDSLNK